MKENRSGDAIFMKENFSFFPLLIMHENHFKRVGLGI
jgi:hypothetical protein